MESSETAVGMSTLTLQTGPVSCNSGFPFLKLSFIVSMAFMQCTEFYKYYAEKRGDLSPEHCEQ